MNSIVTRFAPSPTGNLHIGSVRTALINYIVTNQAKKKYPESKFLLRIEDTDINRSTNAYKDNILKNLNWLSIDHDEDVYIQSLHIKDHQKIAYQLIENKKAFKCICSKEDLEKRRIKNRENKNNNKRLCLECESNINTQSLKDNYVVRIKVPLEGEIIIQDKIQGEVKVLNKEIDDFIILIKDGSPTYMLSSVVDDFNMKINLVIRGDDHLNNTFRQIHIYKNLQWQIPKYAHLPLIHGDDGKKLSKRHGSVDIQEFKEKGYLKKSIINNLILLGWSPKNKKEIVEINEILELFKLENISKSSSIFSYNKLNFFNNHFIKNDYGNKELIFYCRNNYILNNHLIDNSEKLFKIFLIYKKNISFYKELEIICLSYFDINFFTHKNKLLNNSFNIMIRELLKILEDINEWNISILEEKIKIYIQENNIKFVKLGKPLRLLLTNLENGPSISDILFILGKENSIQRIKNYIKDL